MSQHQHTTSTKDGKNVVVTLGYDRPLDYVFCTVMQNSDGDQEANVLYSNLSDDDAGTECQDVEYFKPVLAVLGISVPVSMFTEVKIDQLERTGNRTVAHD